MLKFQWNALHRGDAVIVHDGPTMALHDGTVTMIQARRSRRDANVVSIRLTAGAERSRVVSPTYLAVHLAPLDPSEPCWRCDSITAPRLCGRCRESFPGDPTLPTGVDLGTWYCQPCHDVLIGPGAMAHPSRPTRHASGPARRTTPSTARRAPAA